MKKLIGALFLLLFPLFLRAQCTGSSPKWTSAPDQSSVNTCVSKASPGDTINILSGTATWTTGISTSKNLSIVGAGAGLTVINDDMTASCGALFRFTPTTVGALTRISGMTIQPLSGATAVCPAASIQGTCNLSDCPHLRIDHITFTGWDVVTRINNSYGITAIGDMFGVIDHNTINATPGNLLALTEVNHAQYQGIGLYGDNSWHQPESYGTSNFLFIENNVFNTASCCDNEGNAGVYQTRGGARVVVRFNTFANMDNLSSAFGWHGTESNGRARSGRAFEFYQNTYICPSGVHCGSVAGVRGGTGMVWGNTLTLTGASLNNFFSLPTYRAHAANGGWGPCDGTSPYDTNDGVTYFSGTVGSVSVNPTTGAATITVSGASPGWTTNQWSPLGAPYSVHDITKVNGAEITASGANTLTTSANTGGPGSWLPTSGDSFQILRATACVDQSGGRGAGILYDSTESPANPVPANEVASPAYFWLNPFTGGSPSLCTSIAGVCSGSGRVMRSRDFYAENLNQTAQTNTTSPFDGTNAMGIGHGTITNRPATCIDGTGYWATDQGTWNTSGSGGQGVLYICGAGGWPSSPYYTPYTYPHPLVTGSASGTGETPPSPPTGLTAIVQ